MSGFWTERDMLRPLLIALALLHLGPGFAFLLLAFGCDGLDPGLGTTYCGRPLASFAWTTLGLWVAMTPVAVWWEMRRRVPAAD